MTPEEHQLISGLFDRMRAQGPVDKDREAEALIMNSIMTTPDAAYKLVQSVLVMEGALEEAQSRIEQMEQRIQQLEDAGQARPATGGGGFLGSLFGGSKQQTPPPRPTSVPMSAARPMGYGQPQQAATPWGNQGGYQGQPAGYQQQPPARQGGGFMKSAMATAAGVAGGVLVANAIGNMFGGSQAHAASGQSPAGNSPAGSKGGDNSEYQDSASNDPGTYEQEQQGAEQQDEGGGGWFGGGGDSDDSEF